MDFTIINNNTFGYCEIKGEGIEKVERQVKGDTEFSILFDKAEDARNSFIDYSCELGVTYVYRINGSTSLTSTETYYEDIVLYDAQNGSVLIRFNPTVTSFKLNQAETVTQTLGGKYPVIRRNGVMDYNTFTIGGMISALAESTSYSYKNRTTDERKYRQKILDSLKNGKVKLFKSGPEGNMLIRLTNITLTSEAKLDRDIYSFSATATEIASPTIENMKRFNIFNTEEKYYTVSASETDMTETFFTVV